MTEPVRLDDLITLVKTRRPGGDPLDRLTEAVQVGEHLGEVSDHLIGHFVDQARRAGSSWTEIGQYMGVTKQAAQKRFVPRAGNGPEALDVGVFGRFTDRARQVIVAAQEEARRTGQPLIGPEHLVLGVLTVPEGLAAQTITALGVTPDAVQAAMEAGLAPATETPTGHVPFSGPAKKAIELTARESLRLGHDFVGTEHILLGVLADAESPAAAALAGIGIGHAAVEDWIVERITAVLGDRPAE